MYNFLTKNGQILALGLGLAVVAIFLGSVFSGFNSAGYDMSTDLNSLSDEAKGEITFFNSGIALTLILTAAAFVFAFVIFGLVDLIKFPKSAIKFLIGIAVLAVIFFLLYTTSDVETAGKIGELHDRFDITPHISKFISGGIKTTLGLLGFAFLAFILGEIWSLVK